MSKTRASASSRVPNTEKQMKARGLRPRAFICFEVFGTRDEARSPSFWHVFSNETIRNYVVTCFLKSNNDKLCSVTFLPFTEKTRLHAWWIVVVQLASDHEWRRGVFGKVREPKTFCEEEELVEKAVLSSTKYKNKWALSVFGEWQFARTIQEAFSRTMTYIRSRRSLRVSKKCSFANCSVKIKVQYLQ